MRGIDCTINVADTLQELMGNQAPKKENRVGSGFSNFGHPEVLGTRVEEKANMTQLPAQVQ